MAIFLIKDRDATNQDPVKNERGCYKAGDIVQVFPDGTPYVKPPAAPFYIIEVTGLSIANAMQYMSSIYEVVSLDDPPQLLKRRRFYVGLTALPNQIRNALTRNRYIVREWSQISQYVMDKLAG